MYEGFADLYDRFMSDVPYEEWAKYIEEVFARYAVKKPRLITDLGCGTGNLTLPLARAGYEMTAIDASPDMLNVLREKAMAAGQDILCLCQDMRELELFGTMDAILCTCDGINYLTEEEDLVRTFRLVENYLEPEGLFVFDVNTEARFKKYGSQTFTDLTEDAAYIWQNEYDASSGINRYDITFFEADADSRYSRFEETHLERAYSVDKLKELLETAGLKCEAVLDAFTFEPATEKSDRVCFVAREHLYKELGHKRSLEDIFGGNHVNENDGYDY